MKRDAPIEYKGYWIAVVVTPEGRESRGQFWVAEGADGAGLLQAQTLLPRLRMTEEDAWYDAERAAMDFIDALPPRAGTH